MNRSWKPLVLLAFTAAAGTSSCSEDEKPAEVSGQAMTGGEGGGPAVISTGGSPGVTIPEGGESGALPTGGDSGASGICGGLICGALEECRMTAGGGFECVRVACDKDVDCPESEYCDGRVCTEDACEGGTQRCDGNTVVICSPNGAAEEPAYACSGSEFFESTCETIASGATGCTCEDDWDCPANTECDAGVCVGTGEAPTCTLPPADFSEVLPTLEFHWGGTSAAEQASASAPFGASAQVVSTPVVANLSDDNGDGLIDERDFPEILFLSYRGNTPGELGIVRAVHGGGADKGKDYFALCGDPEQGGAHWFEGDAISLNCGTDLSNALARPAGALSVGDLNDDGVPEIVVPTTLGGLQILDNEGNIIARSADDLWPHAQSPDFWASPSPAIANLDFEGPPEIVVGNRVVTLEIDAAGALSIARVFTGAAHEGVQDATSGDNYLSYYGPMVCVADVVEQAPGLEIVAGTSAYGLPAAESCDGNPDTDFCRGRLTLLWDAQIVNGTTAASGIPEAQSDGFCAVADVLGERRDAAPGPDNPLDGKPEVVLIANGYLIVLDGESGGRLRYQQVDQLVTGEPGAGTRGGAPNIDDFDGDGFPEIATALTHYYTVIDLQAPAEGTCPAWPALFTATGASPGTQPARLPFDAASNPTGTCARDGDCSEGAVCSPVSSTCVCLHNGWARRTEDDSSRATSSSVFDFNGDGASEVVYNDQCYFRVYGGATGEVYFAQPSLSRTVVENPVVADVDNDGNAEIIVVSNNETRQCTQNQLTRFGGGTVVQAALPNGIDVWGDANDTWVSARRIWNQHSYHVTNVTESGRIPLHEPPSYAPQGDGRTLNTYRSQPRTYGIAPDLTVVGIQISSPGAECGTLTDEITISIEVQNQGDLRVGPGILVEFYGTWGGEAAPLTDAQGDPVAFTLDKSLDPNSSVLISVTYDASESDPGTLPDSIRVVVDPPTDSSDHGLERECDEDNNAITKDVNANEGISDLSVEIVSADGCVKPLVQVTVSNAGAAPAEDFLVTIYLGDPSQGGKIVGEVEVPGPIAPGESVDLEIALEQLTRNVTLYGSVDRTDTVLECNDANNYTKGPAHDCAPIAE